MVPGAGASSGPNAHLFPCCAQVFAKEPGIDRGVYGPYLLLLEPEQLAVIAMHCECCLPL